MRPRLACLAIVSALISGSALAQKHGGVLIVPHIDSPPSPSIQEEATASVVIPFMPMFNNLVIFDQHVAQHSLETIRPELATAWKWTE
ncbi:MAG: peptide/nickel transport system substrate-binding protein, partial [Acetobacteraceae bacterium]|nr:peptide/nickel transport system substrate-binding protein [Acetobacteraceae bacterium]